MKNKGPFICPYCKEESGWNEVTPIRGRYTATYNELGEEVDGNYEVTTSYKPKCICRNCDRNITKAVQKYLGLDKERD